MRTTTILVGIVSIMIIIIAMIPDANLVSGATPSYDVRHLPTASNQNPYNANIKIADYFFNKGSGSVIYDDSGKGNDGARNGAAWCYGRDKTTGTSNALSFDGVDDFIQVPHSSDFNLQNIDNWVIYSRIKMPVWNTGDPHELHTIISKHTTPYTHIREKGYVFNVDWAGNLGLQIDNDYAYNDGNGNLLIAYGAQLRDNAWHTVGCAKIGNTYYLIKDPTPGNDGILCQYTDPLYTVPYDCSDPLGIGGIPTDPGTGYYGNHPFIGIIDEVHMFELVGSNPHFPTRGDNIGWWSFDSNWIDAGDETNDYINDRATSDFENIGVMYGADKVNTNRVEGECSLELQNTQPDPSVVTEYAVVPHNPRLNFDNGQNMYIEAWFQTENLEERGRQTILSKFESTGSISDGYVLEIDQQRISLRLFNGNNIGRAWGTYQIQNSYWYHVWATYDYGSNNIKIELNIIQNGNELHAESVTSTYDFGIGTTTCGLYFGTWYNGANGNFHSPIYNGYLDGIIFATGSSF